MPSSKFLVKYGHGLLAASASLCLFAAVVHAANRPIPEIVNVKAFARPEGRQLELLVRVPLAAVKDVQFPARGTEGYLDLAAVKSMLPGAARYWIASGFDVFENGTAVARPDVSDTRISISSDQSFDSYKAAVDNLAAPDLPNNEELFWDHVWLDMRLRYPLASDRPVLAIEPKLAGLGVRVLTDMSYVAPDGNVRTFSFEGNPGVIYLDPRWTDAARQFVVRGVRYVATGAVILLFLFCLALPFRRYGDAAPPVIAFAAALLLAVLASLFGLTPDAVWFAPLVATLEAVAILLVAFANIAGRVTPRRRTLFALCAGLVFGFSAAFRLAGALQFGGTHLVVSTLAFYAGLVVALSVAVALLIPVLSFLFSLARIEYIERIIVSALAADTAWGWLGDRWTQLRKIPFQLVFDAGVLAPALRALTVLVLFGGLLWFVNEWLKSLRVAGDESTPQPGRKTAI